MSVQPTPLTSPDPQKLASTALRLAAAGYPVFPCVPDQKRPLTGHGLLDATTDPDWIRGWWRRAPTANLAIATGTLNGTASFDVLDVDVRDTGSGYPAFNALSRAGLIDGHSHTIVTPTGGLHAYFPGSRQHSSRLPEAHLDFKAAGGYVLTPPSVVNGHSYELIHRSNGPFRRLDWPAVRDHLQPEATPTAPTAPHPGQRATAQGIEPLAQWVAQLPEGRRNAGTFWAACRAVEQGEADLRPLIDAAVTAGLPRRKATATVRSAVRRAFTPPAYGFRTDAPPRGSGATPPPLGIVTRDGVTIHGGDHSANQQSQPTRADAAHSPLIFESGRCHVSLVSGCREHERLTASTVGPPQASGDGHVDRQRCHLHVRVAAHGTHA
jgi:hypothetical protein